MVSIGAVKIYSIQMDGIPLEIQPCLGLFTLATAGTIYDPHHRGGAIFYLHLCLYGGGSM